jgi:uncharacterized hydrophobic protein (TIGR00271 family)
MKMKDQEVWNRSTDTRETLPVQRGEVEVNMNGIDPMPELNMSDTGYIVDPMKHIDCLSQVSNGTAQLPGLRDWARIVQLDGRFSEVSVEQLARVKMMHDRFVDAASFSFNYNTLLFVASILAGLGLVSNSTATIIASMLVSPIMGPVVGLAYGTTIADWRLVSLAFKTECISLVFCITMGATLAAVTGPTSLGDDWPTAEMLSRGRLQNLYVGLPIAFFSGLGVAVSLLDDQTASLVGVAISASLLPPAVNAGIMWVAHAFLENDVIAGRQIPEMTLARVNSTRFLRHATTSAYSHDDFREMGFISLGLTLANILLIWISSMIMFRVKEASFLFSLWIITPVTQAHTFAYVCRFSRSRRTYSGAISELPERSIPKKHYLTHISIATKLLKLVRRVPSGAQRLSLSQKVVEMGRTTKLKSIWSTVLTVVYVY